MQKLLNIRSRYGYGLSQVLKVASTTQVITVDKERTAGWSHVHPREIALYSSIVGATSIQSRVQRKVGLPGHTVVISRKTCKRNIPQVRNEDLIAATIETKLAIACRLLFFHTYSRKSEPSSHVPFMHLIILITSFRCLPPHKPSPIT